jgi:hypothetical protein
MRDAGSDRMLRIIGHYFQNRWRAQIGGAQHCRNPVESHRAGADLRVPECIECRVASVDEPEMIANRQHGIGGLPSEVSIREVVAKTDLLPAIVIEEEPKIICAVQIAQGVILDDQLDRPVSRHGNEDIE